MGARHKPTLRGIENRAGTIPPTKRENLTEVKIRSRVFTIYGAPCISAPGEALARYSSMRIYLHPAVEEANEGSCFIRAPELFPRDPVTRLLS